LRNREGVPTNAVFGFKNMLLQLLKAEDPSHCVMVFDKAGPTFRNEIYPEYKSNRDAAPDDLRVQFEPIFRFSKLLNLPVIQVDGFEADDVIGSLTKKLSDQISVTIISGDKDLTQLVTNEVHMLDTMNNRRFTPEEVEVKFGVSPGMIPEYLALIGDSSDNIPGASGIGPKTAVKLFKKFGNLDGILDNTGQLRGKQKENLENSRGNIEMSLRLTQINCDLEFDATLEDYSRKEPDFEKLQVFYEEMDFKPDDFFKMIPGSEFTTEITEKKSSLDYESYQLVTDRDHLRKICNTLMEEKKFALDLETTSLHPIDARIVGFALAGKEAGAVYVPVAHSEVVSQLSVADVLEELAPLLQNESLHIVGQNIKYEMMVLANYDVKIKCRLFDTMLESYLLDANLHRHNLDDLADRHLQHKMIKYEDVTGKGKKQICFSEVPLEKALHYAAEDADATLKVHDKIYPNLKSQALQDLYETIELPLCRTLAEVERHGVKVDTDCLDELNERFSIELEGLRSSIFQHAGQEFNINSTQQLSKVLFDDLGINVAKKKTKTGFSTDASVLEKIALYEPIGKDLLAYRTKNKLINTYLQVLPTLVNTRTGRIHTSYNQAVAATGRLASTNPNLQNIPIKDEDGRKIRKAFVAEKGNVLISADYSQVELRFLAHLSEDSGLIEVFEKGGDIHTETAAAIYQTGVDHVTSDQRRASKAINFGIIYGMGAFRLSQEIGVTQKEAKFFIDSYFSRYPGIRSYMDKTLDFCREHGFVETMFKRKRIFPDIDSKNHLARTASERGAINSRIQGSAADLIKIAMIQVSEIIKKDYPDVKMIMQVHDELVFEAPEAIADQFKTIVTEIMEKSVKLHVPLVVDAEIGQNWQEAH
jgi:DNA polymerase I